MAFYDLRKEERVLLVQKIHEELLAEIRGNTFTQTLQYFSDPDTYIRKSAYLSIGRIYKEHPSLLQPVISRLDKLFTNQDFKIRQTSINGAGEIGKINFAATEHFFDQGLFDTHHSVRNAVIGSIKKMGEKNPVPVLEWAAKYLHHPDKEIRREICHGIELRGRTHPHDILPMLKELQFDKTARVKNTLVHVIGQIAYKQGCLETVMDHIVHWENKDLVKSAIEEIIDVHYSYRNFSVLTLEEAISFIQTHLKRHDSSQLCNHK